MTLRDRKKHNTSGKNGGRRHRGRPSKKDFERTLSRDGPSIANEIGPLCQPVGQGFQKYYERFRRGHLCSLVEYYTANRKAHHLDRSFYELTGRLFFLQHYRAVDQILRQIGQIKWIDKRERYEYWYRLLLPVCQKARKFIDEARSAKPDAKRTELWNEYRQSPPPFVYPHLRNHDAGSMTPINQEDRIAQLSAITGLIEAAESRSESRADWYWKTIRDFARWGLVPKRVFFDLALSKNAGRRSPVYTPSELARRYACGIAGISESSISRKRERK